MKPKVSKCIKNQEKNKLIQYNDILVRLMKENHDFSYLLLISKLLAYLEKTDFILGHKEKDKYRERSVVISVLSTLSNIIKSL